MVDRVLSCVLLVASQLAMLSAAQASQGLLAAAISSVVGVALIVLMVGAAERAPLDADADEAELLEHLAFAFPMH